MKMTFLLRSVSSRSVRMSDDELTAAMDTLRELRLEVAVAELEAELRRSRIHVLYPARGKTRQQVVKTRK